MATSAKIRDYRSQVPRRLFFFLVGNLAEGMGRSKRAREELSRDTPRPSPPYTTERMAAAGTGKRKETTGDLARDYRK